MVAAVSEPFDVELFAELAEVEQRNFWFRARNRVILWALARWFGDAGSFLEIGCGTGFVLQAVAEAFPQLELCASDMYEEGLAFAQRRVPRAEVLCADATTIRCERPWDVAGAFDVLEHIGADTDAIRAVSACLSPGGGLIVTVPQHPLLWSPFDAASRHVRRYRRGELEGKLEANGFRILHSTSFMSLPLPLFAAARLGSRRRSETSVVDELRRGDAAAPVLDPLLAIEFALLRRGVRFAAGSSRLVVARL